MVKAGKYWVTVSKHGKPSFEVGFSDFDEALTQARILEQRCPDMTVDISNMENAEGELVDGQWRWHNGLTKEEREQWRGYDAGRLP